MKNLSKKNNKKFSLNRFFFFINYFEEKLNAHTKLFFFMLIQ